MKNKTGLYFGSFNPLHNGHLSIARKALDHGLRKVWFVVSPQNPLKEKNILFPADQRLEMVKTALSCYQEFEACDIEFYLPRPSYTIHTLQKLEALYPDHLFTLIIGSDSLEQIHLWKSYEEILQRFELIVYPRSSGYKIPDKYKDFRIKILEEELLPISSTQIREMIKKRQDISGLVPQEVYNYLKKNIL